VLVGAELDAAAACARPAAETLLLLAMPPRLAPALPGRAITDGEASCSSGAIGFAACCCRGSALMHARGARDHF